MTTSRLGMLTSNSETPVMSNTTVSSDLLQSFNVITELSIHVVSQQMRRSTGRSILLSVQHPIRDLELLGVLHDSNETLDFFFVQFTGSSAGVDFSLLADDKGVSSANTLDGGESEGDASLTIDVGVHDTKHVNKVFRLNQGLWKGKKNRQNEDIVDT